MHKRDTIEAYYRPRAASCVETVSFLGHCVTRYGFKSITWELQRYRIDVVACWITRLQPLDFEIYTKGHSHTDVLSPRTSNVMHALNVSHSFTR